MKDKEVYFLQQGWDKLLVTRLDQVMTRLWLSDDSDSTNMTRAHHWHLVLKYSHLTMIYQRNRFQGLRLPLATNTVYFY